MTISRNTTAAVFLACAAIAATSPALTAEGGPNPPSRCGAFPATPSIPDGAKADRKAMMAANEAVTTWGKSAQPVLDCRRAEVQELRARLDALTKEYNDGIAQSEALVKTYEAEAAKFNAR